MRDSGSLTVTCLDRLGRTTVDTVITVRDLDAGGIRVEAICRVLGATECGFITSRGYRAAQARPRSARAIRDDVLTEELCRVHAELRRVHPSQDVARDAPSRLADRARPNR